MDVTGTFDYTLWLTRGMHGILASASVPEIYVNRCYENEHGGARSPKCTAAVAVWLSAHDLKFVPQSLSELRGTVASAGVRQYATKSLRRRRRASMTCAACRFRPFRTSL